MPTLIIIMIMITIIRVENTSDRTQEVVVYPK